MNKLFNTEKMRVLCVVAIFVLAVGVTGCAKKLAPEVEQPPEETVETVSTESVEEPEETQLEEGFDIETQETTESGAFITSSPEEQPEITEETTIPDFEARGTEELESSKTEQMDMSTDVFEAEPQERTAEVEEPVQEEEPKEAPVIEDTAKVFEQPEEPEKIEEARLLSFQASEQVEDVYFAFDSYDLDEKGKARLRANAEWLKQNPNAKVEIQGHCDERGTNNYNLGLGERRALATKKFLASQGIDESRLHTISYGEEKPFCFQSNESCWWRNRRAHFMISE